MARAQLKQQWIEALRSGREAVPVNPLAVLEALCTGYGAVFDPPALARVHTLYTMGATCWDLADYIENNL